MHVEFNAGGVLRPVALVRAAHGKSGGASNAAVCGDARQSRPVLERVDWHPHLSFAAHVLRGCIRFAPLGSNVFWNLGLKCCWFWFCRAHQGAHGLFRTRLDRNDRRSHGGKCKCSRSRSRRSKCSKCNKRNHKRSRACHSTRVTLQLKLKLKIAEKENLALRGIEPRTSCSLSSWAPNADLKNTIFARARAYV